MVSVAGAASSTALRLVEIINAAQTVAQRSSTAATMLNMFRLSLILLLTMAGCTNKPEPKNVLLPTGYGSATEMLLLPNPIYVGDTPPLKLSGGTYAVAVGPHPDKDHQLTPEDFLACESIVTLTSYGQQKELKQFLTSTQLFKTTWSGIPEGIYALHIGPTSKTPCPMQISMERLGD
jgi:hypothetical protein